MDGPRCVWASSGISVPELDLLEEAIWCIEAASIADLSGIVARKLSIRAALRSKVSRGDKGDKRDKRGDRDRRRHDRLDIQEMFLIARSIRYHGDHVALYIRIYDGSHLPRERCSGGRKLDIDDDITTRR